MSFALLVELGPFLIRDSLTNLGYQHLADARYVKKLFTLITYVIRYKNGGGAGVGMLVFYCE